MILISNELDYKFWVSKLKIMSNQIYVLLHQMAEIIYEFQWQRLIWFSLGPSKDLEMGEGQLDLV